MPRELRKRILNSPVKCDNHDEKTKKPKDIPRGFSRGRKHESLKKTEEQARSTRAKSKIIPREKTHNVASFRPPNVMACNPGPQRPR